MGAGYRIEDDGVISGITYNYRLEEIDSHGKARSYGVITASLDGSDGAETMGVGISGVEEEKNNPPLSPFVKVGNSINNMVVLLSPTLEKGDIGGFEE